jgi:glutathione synthase/RimK-type ligase-like ATP-grasp enzyme
MGSIERISLGENYMQWAKSMANDNIGINCISLENLIFTINNGEAKIVERSSGTDIKSYDQVLFRNMHVLSQQDVYRAVYVYLKHFGVKIHDEINLQGACFGKLSQMLLFCLNGIKTPDTLCSKFDLAKNAAGFIHKPFIFKALDGIMGSDNYLLSDFDEAEKIQAEKKKFFVAQNFINNDGDYRLLYIGDDIPLVYHRHNDKSHLNNIARGGKLTKIDLKDFDQKALSIGRKVKELSECEIIGADLMRDKNSGDWYVLEANSTPALGDEFLNNDLISKLRELVKKK